eukprot:Lankesteria_metandrocarpae@DN8205_c0_g1_i1.p1
MANKPNTLIQKLIEAEEEADVIVKKARENRTRKLKEAQQCAKDELDLFREKEDKRFEKEFEEAFGDKDTVAADLEKRTKKELENVKRDFSANKHQALDFLLTSALDVHLSIPDVQCRQLKRTAGLLK